MRPAFVIKAAELAALNYLPPDHPRPSSVEWINRVTNKKLQRSSVDQLLRTYHLDIASPSIVRLHRTSGLRATFQSERERSAFAARFGRAREQLFDALSHNLISIFDERRKAEQAILALQEAGVPCQAISLMFRASQFLSVDFEWPKGHTKLSVASAAAGGGFAAAIFALAVVWIPGIGPLAATGAIASSALSSYATASAVLGATGGTIARMLTDHDVDGVLAAYCEEQILHGKIFVSVDTRSAKLPIRQIRELMRKYSGRRWSRG
jgi:hypothetical protein